MERIVLSDVESAPPYIARSGSIWLGWHEFCGWTKNNSRSSCTTESRAAESVEGLQIAKNLGCCAIDCRSLFDDAG
jgi:hypothetical protein